MLSFTKSLRIRETTNNNMRDDDHTRFSFSNFWSSALRAKTLASSKDNDSVRTDGLIRRLGLFDLILLGIGASIGAGIFVVTGTVAHDAGPG